jgi:outer membrane protein OmpA-like peptidoglycan-associated protein
VSGAFAQPASAKDAERAAGIVVHLDSAYFIPGRIQLRPEAKGRLAPVVEALRSNPGSHVLVEGRADGGASQVENQQAALKHASAVRDAIATQGIAEKRIVVRGVGASSATPASTARAPRRRTPPPAVGTTAPRARVQVTVMGAAAEKKTSASE